MSRRKNRAKNFRARIWRQRERQLLGSHGAASEVRHIDPAEHEPQPQPKTELPPPTQQAQIRTLLDSADTLLVADAKHRYGKRHGERVRGKIVKGCIVDKTTTPGEYFTLLLTIPDRPK